MPKERQKFTDKFRQVKGVMEKYIISPEAVSKEWEERLKEQIESRQLYFGINLFPYPFSLELWGSTKPPRGLETILSFVSKIKKVTNVKEATLTIYNELYTLGLNDILTDKAREQLLEYENKLKDFANNRYDVRIEIVKPKQRIPSEVIEEYRKDGLKIARQVLKTKPSSEREKHYYSILKKIVFGYEIAKENFIFDVENQKGRNLDEKLVNLTNEVWARHRAFLDKPELRKIEYGKLKISVTGDTKEKGYPVFRFSRGPIPIGTSVYLGEPFIVEYVEKGSEKVVVFPSRDGEKIIDFIERIPIKMQGYFGKPFTELYTLFSGEVLVWDNVIVVINPKKYTSSKKIINEYFPRK